jgi:hypothetical protein
MSFPWCMLCNSVAIFHFIQWNRLQSTWRPSTCNKNLLDHWWQNTVTWLATVPICSALIFFCASEHNKSTVYNCTVVRTINGHNKYGMVLQMYLTIHKYSIATNVIYSNNNYMFWPQGAIIRLYNRILNRLYICGHFEIRWDKISSCIFYYTTRWWPSEAETCICCCCILHL